VATVTARHLWGGGLLLQRLVVRGTKTAEHGVEMSFATAHRSSPFLAGRE
jgi:hypothetical protein